MAYVEACNGGSETLLSTVELMKSSNNVNYFNCSYQLLHDAPQIFVIIDTSVQSGSECPAARNMSIKKNGTEITRDLSQGMNNYNAKSYYYVCFGEFKQGDNIFISFNTLSNCSYLKAYIFY